jgi:hypothetical protein
MRLSMYPCALHSFDDYFTVLNATKHPRVQGAAAVDWEPQSKIDDVIYL